MGENKKEKYEDKMRRHEENEERRKNRIEKEEREHGKTPWYANNKVWLYIGVAIACALLLYWVLFMAIWEGPNQ